MNGCGAANRLPGGSAQPDQWVMRTPKPSANSGAGSGYGDWTLALHFRAADREKTTGAAHTVSAGMCGALHLDDP
jgi:hypothetical protein